MLQITLIPSCGDVLILMKGGKSIKRISNGKLVTTYVKTDNVKERYHGVGSTGEQAYACTVHDMNVDKTGFEKMSLLDEFGRILMSLCLPEILYPTCISRMIFCSNERNKFFKTYEKTLQLDYINDDNIKTAKSYNGSLGTSPVSAFIPHDIAIDNRGSLLVAVRNDNAIHLLDNTLAFQRLLLTEEDGLHGPTSVALDAEGFLYVGCEDGQIHVVNYQYLLNTNRQTRLKFQNLISNDSSLNFPGHFCQKIFDEVLKNHKVEN